MDNNIILQNDQSALKLQQISSLQFSTFDLMKPSLNLPRIRSNLDKGIRSPDSGFLEQTELKKHQNKLQMLLSPSQDVEFVKEVSKVGL
jgi:hypothetical protein